MFSEYHDTVAEYSNAALNRDAEKEMICYALSKIVVLIFSLNLWVIYLLKVRPEHCTDGLPGQSIECFMSLWEEIGCLSNGSHAPDVLPAAVLDIYNSSSLR